MTFLLRCVAIAVLLGGAACGPTYVIVRPAPPNPYDQIRSLMIEPVHFENLMVGRKSEIEWQAHKSADEQRSWQTDKAAMSNELMHTVMANLVGRPVVPAPPGAGAAPGTALIRVSMTYIEPGQYAYVYKIDTEAQSRIEVLDANGAVIDTFTVGARVPAMLSDPASGPRMREAASEVGVRIGRFLSRHIRGG